MNGGGAAVASRRELVEFLTCDRLDGTWKFISVELPIISRRNPMEYTRNYVWKPEGDVNV